MFVFKATPYPEIRNEAEGTMKRSASDWECILSNNYMSAVDAAVVVSMAKHHADGMISGWGIQRALKVLGYPVESSLPVRESVIIRNRKLGDIKCSVYRVTRTEYDRLKDGFDILTEMSDQEY